MRYSLILGRGRSTASSMSNPLHMVESWVRFGSLHLSRSWSRVGSNTWTWVKSWAGDIAWSNQGGKRG